MKESLEKNAVIIKEEVLGKKGDRFIDTYSTTDLEKVFKQEAWTMRRDLFKKLLPNEDIELNEEIDSVVRIDNSKKGILGIGKKPPLYRINIFQYPKAIITFRKKAEVEAVLEIKI